MASAPSTTSASDDVVDAHHRRSRRDPAPGGGRRRTAVTRATYRIGPPLRSRPMPPAPERWTAIVNPAAGRGRARARLPRVLDALAAADLDLEIVLSADADDLVTAPATPSGEGAGSSRAGVTAPSARSPASPPTTGGVLGIVPLGSGNDFARQLDIPRGDLDAAIDVLRTGHVRRRPTSDARTRPTAPRRGSPRSPTPGSTRWRTRGPTTSRGRAARRSTCSPRCARWRRTRPRPCASPSTTRPSRPTPGWSRWATPARTRAG